MTAVIEMRSSSSALTQRQRWGHYFAIFYGLISLVIGFGLQSAALSATTTYTSAEAGIRAAYPRGWLLDTGADYIFRVRDMAQTGFKTTIQVSALPVTLNATARNLLVTLILDRSLTLSEYSVSSYETISIQNGIPATAMRYTFAASEENPFLENRPAIVQGIDILTLRGGQAVVITFLSEIDNYALNTPYFEQFLQDLEF